MSMASIRKDAAEAGGNAELLVEAAERAASKFMYFDAATRDYGWDTSQLDALEALWWKHHNDETGEPTVGTA